MAAIFLSGVRPTAALAAPAAEDEAEYQRLLREGIAEFDAGRFEEARAMFRRAHELSPNARTLRGIGMASFELRDYVVALRALKAALVETRRPLTDEQRKHVRDLIARTATFVGIFTVRPTPTDAAVLVDNRPAQLEPDGTVLVGFGAHEIVAQREGYESARVTVDVVGGEQRVIDLPLRPSPSAPPPPLAPAPPPPEQPSRRWPWFAGAGGAAIAAGVGAIWWSNRAGELEDCEAAGAACQNADTLRGQRNAALALTVVGAVGAASLLVVGMLAKGGEAPAEQRVSFVCLPQIAGASCALRF